jgi:hypothetical protein
VGSGIPGSTAYPLNAGINLDIEDACNLAWSWRSPVVASALRNRCSASLRLLCSAVMERGTGIVLKSMGIHDKQVAAPKPGVEATLTVRIEAARFRGNAPPLLLAMGRIAT